jgi:hypothetical protein
MNFFLACSSIEYLNLSYTIAYITVGGGAVVVIVSFLVELRRKRFSWLPIYTLMLACYPAWRLLYEDAFLRPWRPGIADCGFADRGESIFLLIAHIAGLVLISTGRGTKQMFILLLTVSCWVAIPLSYVGGPAPYVLLSKCFSPDTASQILATLHGAAARMGGWYALPLTFISLIGHLRRGANAEND